MTFRFNIKDVFTLFILGVLITAVTIASEWILRASIIVLVLGSVGIVLVTAQLLLDCLTPAPRPGAERTLKYELPTYDQDDSKTMFRRSVEMWAWLFGVLVSIPLLGMPITLPLFVFVYVKVYGGTWLTACLLAALIGLFIFGIYQQIMHVYWPESLLGDLLFAA